MFGKTTMSSSGTSSSVLNLHHLSVVATSTIVASTDEATQADDPKAQPRSAGAGPRDCEVMESRRHPILGGRTPLPASHSIYVLCGFRALSAGVARPVRPAVPRPLLHETVRDQGGNLEVCRRSRSAQRRKPRPKRARWLGKTVAEQTRCPLEHVQVQAADLLRRFFVRCQRRRRLRASQIVRPCAQVFRPRRCTRTLENELQSVNTLREAGLDQSRQPFEARQL